jgi:hypothetical protein
VHLLFRRIGKYKALFDLHHKSAILAITVAIIEVVTVKKWQTRCRVVTAVR